MTMTRQERQDRQADVIHAALSVMYREDLTDEQREACRQQIARIEKLFGFEPFSFHS